ncbi:MAG: 2-succinyl-5-enolpyruvyl-6-hydroxy-3-cyclohexene-1-carboxylic-acid synthase, partial [Chloroflexi bacterium]|nr:2-succinyl-5-enolpyruvyl-6-hydroxy-3-cyclohexene-1-carboxylic-acid synthase [Chloroflexota bacterium]
MRYENRNYAFAGAFVEELARCGLHHVCICPGSRSSPLAISFARQPAIKTWVHLDERSASFFALGMARALGEPVALVCSSGTATANFHPAVIEARHSLVPILLLTADRPPELSDWGALQTVDQVKMYGPHAKWSVNMPPPEAT